MSDAVPPDLMDVIIQKTGSHSDHRYFYSQVYSLIAQEMRLKGQNKDFLVQAWIEDFDEVSVRMDQTQIQESCSMRNVVKTRTLAQLLIKEDGSIDEVAIAQAISIIENNLFSLGPLRHHDAMRDKQVLNALNQLLKEKKLFQLLKRVSRPSSNKVLDQVIRCTLNLSLTEPVTDVHARRACLAAWMCTLRQSLGSCFATAPAIIVHDEQPHLFLQDITELFNTGRLKRTFGGKEYAVPMSLTWGNGDLKKPFVLQRTLDLDEKQMWLSPGLVAAFEACGLIDPHASFQEKMEQSRYRIEKAISILTPQNSPFWTNAEDLIQAALLDHLNIRRKQVEEYLSRPQKMVHPGIVSAHSLVQGKSAALSLSESISQYLRLFDSAKIAFKNLADNALLKTWEFTLASFAEIKMEFTRWNLYSSLGVGSDEKGGMGECVYKTLNGRLDHYNNQVKSQNEEYEQVLGHVRYLETRLRTAQTEKEVQWLKVEYQTRVNDLNHMEELLKLSQNKAHKVANLFPFMMQTYDIFFADHFQEVYDADIHDVSAGPFDDSPAGFRLLFKHGRNNPSLWSRIESLNQFVECLVSFLTITEQELINAPEVIGIEQEVSQIITQLVHHVRSDEFLETAFDRMAVAHQVKPVKKPLQNLEKVEKKPWVYTSGGSMSTLVSAYFKREEKPLEKSRWVENESELLVFFIDVMKHLKSVDSEQFIDHPYRSMLMHSPTHAFLLKPGFSLFVEGWKSDMYPYTWIKQKYVEPRVRLAKSIWVEEKIAEAFYSELLMLMPIESRKSAQESLKGVKKGVSLPEFRKLIIERIVSEKCFRTPSGLALYPEDIDSLIFSLFPFTGRDQLRRIVDEIIQYVMQDSYLTHAQALNRATDACMQQLSSQCIALSSKSLQALVKAIFCLATGALLGKRNLHADVLNVCRNKEVAMPAPLIFADTNWVKDYFAFVVNPGTCSLELWAVDALGSTGKAISHWKKWLDGSHRSPDWGIFSQRLDYTGL